MGFGVANTCDVFCLVFIYRRKQMTGEEEVHYSYMLAMIRYLRMPSHTPGHAEHLGQATVRTSAPLTASHGRAQPWISLSDELC